MWLLLNLWWVLLALAAILALLAVIPATAKLAEYALAWVPRDAWPILAAIVAISLCAGWLVDYGEDRCEARWEAAQEATQAEIDRRERAAFDAGAQAALDAAKSRQDTRKQTDEVAERVRVVWKEKLVRVPAECRAAVALPDSVRDEGRKAVAAANGAMPD